jgi:hypothetical protein
MKMRAAVLVLTLGVIPLSATIASAQPSPVVVELFTSQGCSSCPPADAFLTDLARQRRDVLPLAFHVTYWDDLGWKDPYSLDVATARQQAYARSLGSGQVYTPEMVVNGTRGFVGSRRAEGLSEISQAASTSARDVPLRVIRAGQALVVSVGKGAGDADILLVGFDPEHQTQVGRGENGGHTLLESNIVRSLTVVGRWTGGAVDFRQAMPAGEQFAVLLQAGDGRILGAARLDPAS